MTRRPAKEGGYLFFLFFKGVIVICSPSKATSNFASSLGRKQVQDTWGSFIQQAVAEHLLCPSHCSRYRIHQGPKQTKISVLEELLFWGRALSPPPSRALKCYVTHPIVVDIADGARKGHLIQELQSRN